MVDAMNFYFESKSLAEINESNFITLYADEAENSSHKECFAMFVTYYANKAVTSFLGILNLKRKTAAEIMDVIKNFFLAKSVKLDKIMLSVLDGTNSMSGKNTGLQRRIRFYSPFNMYINCRNHRLASCLLHLMKDADFAELLIDYDSFIPSKILKAAVTRWLTHGRASQRILDCFQGLLETKDLICLETKETDLRGYRNMLMEHRIIFCLCLTTDILAVMNTLSLALQKQGSLLVDIKQMVEITTDTLRKLSMTNTPSEFTDILSPRKSSYTNNQHFINIISDFQAQRKNLRSHFSQTSINDFHARVTISIIKQLILEIEEAFNTTDFPVMDVFQAFDPRNIPKDLPSGCGEKEIDLIYDFYGSNKINIFQGQRNEATAIIKCSKENFIDQAVHYFCFMSKKKALDESAIAKNVAAAETKLREQEKKKKCIAKTIKNLREHLKLLQDQLKNPMSLNDAIICTAEVLPDICTVLFFISVCPASGAVVKRGFSLMNLIMNDLRSSMNVCTLDATMRIHY